MYRIATVLGLALATFGGAYAGTVVPINLALQQGGVTNCTSCTPQAVTSTAVGFENTLFSNLVPTNPNGSPSTSALTPANGPGSYIPGAQASNGDDAYVTPFLSGTKQGASSLLVDLGTCAGASALTGATGGNCGILDADYLYSMIQAGNTDGDQGVTVTVLGINGSGGSVSEEFTLTAGVDYRDSNSTQTAANCTAADPSTNCASSIDTEEVNNAPGSSSVQVYNNVFGAQSQSGNNYYVDEQSLSLGSLFQSGGYLDQVLIQYTSQSSGARQMTLSGLSADTTAPEPGTIAMLGIGVGLIGLWKIRSRRSKAAPSSR